VQLFIWYFGLPYLNIYLNPFTASVVGFALCSGPITRVCPRRLLSIKRGQLAAALALGFTRLQMITAILLPQGFRRALPDAERAYLSHQVLLPGLHDYCIELTGEAKSWPP